MRCLGFAHVDLIRARAETGYDTADDPRWMARRALHVLYRYAALLGEEREATAPRCAVAAPRRETDALPSDG